MNFYEYISSISQDKKIEYLIILVLGIYFTNKIGISISTLFAFLFFSVIIYYRQESLNTGKDYYNTNTDEKLKTFPYKSKFLYIDADFIHFFYDIRDLRKYSPSNYDNVMRYSDNILRLENEMENKVYSNRNEFETQRDNFYHAINSYHMLSISLPTDFTIQKKFKDGQNILHMLLRKHIDKSYHLYLESLPDKRMDVLYNYGPRQYSKEKKYDFYV